MPILLLYKAYSINLKNINIVNKAAGLWEKNAFIGGTVGFSTDINMCQWSNDIFGQEGKDACRQGQISHVRRQNM